MKRAVQSVPSAESPQVRYSRKTFLAGAAAFVAAPAFAKNPDDIRSVLLHWGLSGGELDGRVLRFRCALAGTSYFEEAGMNEDTGVVAFDGKWHHIALTLAQADGKVTASIYKDYETTPSWTKTKAGRLCYGAGYASVWVGASSSTAFFNGQIDELRISRGILTPDEFLRHGKRGMIISIH